MSQAPVIGPDDRPRVHFTPPAGWLNDPNGLVYCDGEYHLFYQHHPASLVWGPMHWGHAVSRNLIDWEHLPIALAPDSHGMIFSGSAVIDRDNTAGFGAGALVAVFTHHQPERQAQSLAYSTDGGRSWTAYAGNPVLAPADAPADFRDPRVLWYADGERGHWVMALAAGREVWIYTSPDLRTWSKASVFGAGRGSDAGVWECPELISLPVDGGPQRRWVLAISVMEGAPAGGGGMQYVVGDFDGQAFSSDDPPGPARWADHGADFYAAQAWQPASGGRVIWIAWMNNWQYARETPAAGWRGMLTAPREIGLASEGGRLRLVQRLAPEVTAAWAERPPLRDLTLDNQTIRLAGVSGATLWLEARFRVAGATAARFGLRVRAGAAEATVVGYDRERAALIVDRSGAGHGLRAAEPPQAVALGPRDGMIAVGVLVDSASVEVFADGGRVTLTNQIFPQAESSGVELFAEGGAATLVELRAWSPAGAQS